MFALSAGTLTSVLISRVGGIVGICTAVIAAVQVGYNVQLGIPWPQAAYHGNAATSLQYAAVGLGIQPLVGDHSVRSPGEVGTIAYFCNCEILDELSDRGIVVSYYRTELDRRRLRRSGAGVGHQAPQLSCLGGV